MQQYEQALQQLKQTGMFYNGIHKAFVGNRCFNANDNTLTRLNTFGYYEEDGVWMVFITDDERGISIRSKETSSEEEAVEAILKIAQLQNFSHLRHATTENYREKIPMLVAYLQKNYAYTPEKAKETIDYLLHNADIAFEFAYFAEYGQLIPEKFAEKYSGYTAHRLIQEKGMSPIDACCHMIYLQENPAEALQKLQ